VQALLDVHGLEGVSDAVRLAVIVLASRTPSETGVVEIRTPELGRWLGLSASYVASEVVPALRRSGLVSIGTAEGEFGQDIGLRCRVLPMWAAHGVVGHPLALEKQELATLLRLLEALMAPGWTHRDGRVTPAGLLGSRTGRAAATDRLALLLLVLEARDDGRVRQCGGTVDTRRGRAAATVARLLGCTVSRGERVLERLEDRDLVVRVRVGTVSKLRHRTRLVVPAVAAAHGKDGVADAREDRLETAEPEFSDPALAAGGSDAPVMGVKLRVSGASMAGGADVAEPALTAALHTDHSPVVTPVSFLALSCGCSGEGRGTEGPWPGCACAREDQAADVGTPVAESAPPVAEDGPLRGEKPKELPVDERDGQPAARAVAIDRPKVVGWEKAQRQRRRGLPGDLRLREVLEPVTGLWEQLSSWQQDQVQAVVAKELTRLTGLLLRPEMAPGLLAGRLADRLEETGGEDLVDSAYGWLIRRGLVQRLACSDVRCDDGIRLDTQEDCPSCASVIADRRAVRARIRMETAADLTGVGSAELRAVYERRLRAHTVVEAERAKVRHARATAAAQERQVAVARRRKREKEAEWARELAPCADCGLPEAAGLCPACSYARRTDVLVKEAVDLVVVARADLDDPHQVSELTTRCEADTRALISEACQRRGGDAAWAAYAAPEIAEQVRNERRMAAVRRLMASEDADTEADAAYEASLRQRPRDHGAAEAAADGARRRTADYLLRTRLGQLKVLRARLAAGRSPRWAA
jgi:hypothetical protein